jgi:uncharacterized membrane-anchored protein
MVRVKARVRVLVSNRISNKKKGMIALALTATPTSTLTNLTPLPAAEAFSNFYYR